MRFAIDAHTIGRHLTGNEVYIRNLLENYAQLDRESQFFAYVCSEYAASEVPNRFEKRRVSANPFVRLGFDLGRRVLADKPHLLHVQYTAPLYCPVPFVVSTRCQLSGEARIFYECEANSTTDHRCAYG